MLMRARTLDLVVLLTPLLCVVACETHDIGKLCTADSSETVPQEPVPSELPLTEVVALVRSGDCESFKCLTHRGYAAFCTRECAYDADTKGKACSADSDCNRPLHCYQGYCQDDDCPNGFVCSTVQDVGPLAGKLFCVQREGCSRNVDCEESGEISCKTYGCYNATLRDPSLAPELACSDMSELDFCQCPDGNPETRACATSLVCDPPDTDAWPAGAVEQRGVCLRKDR